MEMGQLVMKEEQGHQVMKQEEEEGQLLLEEEEGQLVKQGGGEHGNLAGPPPHYYKLNSRPSLA